MSPLNARIRNRRTSHSNLLYLLDTGHILHTLNVHKTVRRRPGRPIIVAVSRERVIQILLIF